MFGLRNRFERFCLNHRYWGIPNLMLYVTLISGFFYILGLFNPDISAFALLCFDKAKILDGQVWRLFTYIFAVNEGHPLLALVSLYFFYNLSRATELSMGTFRFNLLYFTGVILMDVFAMIFAPSGSFIITDSAIYYASDVYGAMSTYLHMSIVLSFAVANPDARFLVFFIIPVKAWFIALVDLLLLALSVYQLAEYGLSPHCWLPLVGIANFLLFAGVDVLNLLPESIRPNTNRMRRPLRRKAAKPIPFQGSRPEKTRSTGYLHRCTLCGRTDQSNPELEFRYCSRCNGYFCYCNEHISNHTHVE